MIEVELPDGSVAEFPDGTPHAQITAALKAHVAKGAGNPPTQAAQGPSSASRLAADMSHASPSTRGGPEQGFQRAGAGAYKDSPMAGGPVDSITEGPFASGVADMGIKGYRALKQTAAALNPAYRMAYENSQGFKDDAAISKEVSKEYSEDPNKVKRGAGNAAAAMAISALPASALARGASAVSQGLPAALRAIATAGATSGVQGAALNEGQGETLNDQLLSKLKQAGVDTAVGGGLGGLGALFSKALTKMVKPSQEAQKLMDQGVYPTLQQGAEGRAARFVGGLSGEAADVRHRQAQEILDAVTKRASNGNLNSQGSTLKERVGMLEDTLGNEYAAATAGKKFPVSPKVRAEAAATGAATMTKTGQFSDAADEVNHIVAQVMGDAPRNINVSWETLQKNYLTPLAHEVAIAKDPKVRDGLQAVREVLISKVRDPRFTADELANLKNIDSRWYDKMRLQDASSGAKGEGTGAQVKALTAAYANAAKSSQNRTQEELMGPAYRVIGDPSTQDQARSAVAGLRRSLGLGTGLAATGMATGAGPALAGAMAPLYAASLMGQTKQGARVLFGDTAAQKKMAELLRQMAPYLANSGQTLTGEQQ